MSEEFWLRLDSVSDAAEAETKLAALRVGQERALDTKRDGCGVFTSCSIHHALPDDSMLRVENSDRRVPFFDLFYSLEGGKSGMHHPDGMLWIRHPARAHEVHQEPVPLLSVAPTILDLLGIDQPEYMAGESLLRNPTGRRSPGADADLAAAARRRSE